MTLTELNRTLPNGLHDAELLGADVDFIERRVQMRFRIFVDLLPPKSETDRRQEIVFRPATVMLTGVEYFVVEPPRDGVYDGEDAPFVTSHGAEATSGQPDLPELEGQNTFRHWFFVSNWNASIYLAATDASLIWDAA